ncbi:MAG: hypothetical protein QF531_02720, partial [Candidatus Poseidonia sp.]|nr:hypothetical protein [Poseidonia sp.]
MDEALDTLPSDMVPFIQTPVAQPFTRGRNVGLVSSTALATVLFFLLQWLAFSTIMAAGIALLTLAINITVLVMRYQSHASTPLAVNINHPFMSDEQMGKARVMVKLSD